MAKYFLGSVGDAEAYEVITNGLTGESTMNLVFTSKTLTDSAVNISVSKESIIDSYNGAPAGVFYHSPNVTITLSDILWNPKFVEASLGQKFNQMCDDGNIEYYHIELTANSNGYATIPEGSKYPVAIDLPSMDQGGSPYVVVGKMEGDTEWYNYPYDPTTHRIGEYSTSDTPVQATRAGCLLPGAVYCFKYPIASIQSRKLVVTTQIIPEELFLVVTTPIFAADAYSLNPISGEYSSEYAVISTGKKVGKIIYEVPRWVLDSDLSFNFAMSGTSGMQLTGTVLEAIDNEEGSTFMRLREFIKPRMWYEGLVDLVYTANSISQSTITGIYGIYSDGSYEEITSSQDEVRLVFTPSGSSTSSASDTYTYDGITYNVTGHFTSLGSGNIIVRPAVVWLDETEKENLIILDDIRCSVSNGG